MPKIRCRCRGTIDHANFDIIAGESAHRFGQPLGRAPIPLPKIAGDIQVLRIGRRRLDQFGRQIECRHQVGANGRGRGRHQPLIKRAVGRRSFAPTDRPRRRPTRRRPATSSPHDWPASPSIDDCHRHWPIVASNPGPPAGPAVRCSRAPATPRGVRRRVPRPMLGHRITVVQDDYVVGRSGRRTYRASGRRRSSRRASRSAIAATAKRDSNNSNWRSRIHFFCLR